MSDAASLQTSADRTYEAAVALLRSRIRPQRPEKNGGDSGPLQTRVPDGEEELDVRGTPSIKGMKEWLQTIGHSISAIDDLNIIHVAGTKGKGSTCAFAESMLGAFGERTGFPRKTGLYTSPHLLDLGERIRLNRQPISKELFTKYFFEVWDPLSKCETMPRYLQFLAILSLHTFIREGVDAAIIETHHGGEYDATNVIKHPVVAVVTPLGMDHAKQLGPTIRNIAWHKAGIFKPGSAVFSATQDYEETVDVLKQRAAENQALLRFVPRDDPDLPRKSLQLKPDVQRGNCAVALAATRAFLEAKCPKELGSIQPEDISKGISQFSWPGRFQQIDCGRTQWFVDGAHNEMSVSKAAEWFVDMSESLSTSPAPQRILIFSQQSNARDPGPVVERLASSLQCVRIDHVIFSNCNVQQANRSPEKEGSVNDAQAAYYNQLRQEFVKTWERLHPQSQTHLSPDIPSAINMAMKFSEGSDSMHILVTGSLRLVGGALRYLQQVDNGKVSK
ncbi:hypothetical protein jhhlp_004823 [Lomentospora prolificans]|uniref:Folylpolyglutamate synthase n=1 Tax=Lomentospora prolificans TaxID=41688 RepID=A0A2N3N8J8_9PEZI|nr:hypothetical protein jhhlp_004823 [Lomentospora prolificans]